MRDRFARTMEEAFGPGHRGGIWEETPKMHRADKIVVGACAAVLATLAVLIWTGAIK